MLPLPDRPRVRGRLIVLAAVAVLLLVFGRSICSLIIDYQWWKEMGQVSTWVRGLTYVYATNVAECVVIFAVLWIAHARGMKYAGARLRGQRVYFFLSAVALAFVALLITGASMNGWVVARYVAGSGLPVTAWTDPVFGRPLGFYFFQLPFYTSVIAFLETLALAGALVYYLSARGWQIKREFPDMVSSGRLDFDRLRELGRLETGMLQALMAGFLVALAVSFWLDRYQMLYTDHGDLFSGINYIQQNLGLPLQYAKSAAAILAAVLVLTRKRRWAVACAIVLVFDVAIPPLVSSLYVKPNELTLEKPYLRRHIEATRIAYGLASNEREIAFDAHKEGPIDFVKNQTLLDNVRLWDWRAFHDTLSQTQPSRPYAYADTDVDRYVIDGKLRQTLLAPRELDLNQLGDAQNSWINVNVTYTHGYGLVLAEASRISPSGLPELLVRDAPAQVLTPSLKLTRPEIYFGEQAHEPVFAPSQQLEFNYQANPDNKIHYEGTGGFPIGSSALRIVAAIAQGDWNIFLSDAIRPDSRMMIHRKVLDRLGTLAEFIRWDQDPYMVITDGGRLEWIVDGYMTSDLHPYSREVQAPDQEPFNYIRNSVKATVDAYDGSVHLYVFDPADPLIQAYQRLFPDLFSPASAMPADLRAHTRAPEELFRIQAEIYRTYHMRDPESFYNRADLWDLATSAQSQNSSGGGTQSVTPVYMVMTLPGETQPEFVLTISFTPRNKQNLIALMVTRCDGPHLGEVLFLELPKQEIIDGPLQIDALLNQDQVISKDLTLWSQQGSQVLRPPILTIPVDNTFLYVEPLFLQAVQARMPQLQKVVLAVGNTLVYEDTYEKALAALAAIQHGHPPPAAAPSGSAPASGTPSAASPTGAPAGSAAGSNDAQMRLEQIRNHIDRYKQLSAQGKLAEAGKELEAIEQAVGK